MTLPGATAIAPVALLALGRVLELDGWLLALDYVLVLIALVPPSQRARFCRAVEAGARRALGLPEIEPRPDVDCCPLCGAEFEDEDEDEEDD